MEIHPTIYILIGPPGSGKSTWRQALMTSPHVVSSDDIVERIASERQSTYSIVFPTLDWKLIDQEINEAFAAAVKSGLDIVVDRTNMTRKSRLSFLSRVPRSYRRVAVIFSFERDILDARLHHRSATTGKTIPESVVNEMISRYQPPLDEGFHDIIEVRNCHAL